MPRGKPRRDGRNASRKLGPAERGQAAPERLSSYKHPKQEEREWAARSGPVNVRVDPSIVKPYRRRRRQPRA